MPIESAVLSNNCSANNPLNKFFGKLADLIYGQTPSWRFPGSFQEILQSLQNIYSVITEVYSESPVKYLR